MIRRPGSRVHIHKSPRNEAWTLGVQSKSMKRIVSLALIAATLLGSTAALSDDLLGKKRGGGGGDGERSERGDRGNRSEGNSGNRSEGGRQQESSRDRQNGSIQIDQGRNNGNSNRITVQSRSGQVRYGSQNNQSRAQSSRGRTVIQIDDYAAPNSGRPAQEASREHRARPSQSNQYRAGYYHYDPGWCDDYFVYPHYRFNYEDNCVPSPWYRYGHLPAYVNQVRVRFDIPEWNFSIDGTYSWGQDRDDDSWGWGDRNDRWDRGVQGRLRAAIYDIERVFTRRDLRALGRLVPRRGEVVIRSQDTRPYVVRSDDFYDMFADAVFTTRTRSYRLERLTTGRGGAYAIFRHEFVDSWNQRRQQFHSYVFEDDRWEPVIVEFGVWNHCP